jgi:hypothetical protein
MIKRFAEFTVFMPNCAALMAAMYPPGPLPMTTMSASADSRAFSHHTHTNSVGETSGRADGGQLSIELTLDE